MTYYDVKNILLNGITDQNLICKIEYALVRCELNGIKPKNALMKVVEEISNEYENRIVSKYTIGFNSFESGVEINEIPKIKRKLYMP